MISTYKRHQSCTHKYRHTHRHSLKHIVDKLCLSKYNVDPATVNMFMMRGTQIIYKWEPFEMINHKCQVWIKIYKWEPFETQNSHIYISTINDRNHMNLTEVKSIFTMNVHICQGPMNNTSNRSNMLDQMLDMTNHSILGETFWT